MSKAPDNASGAGMEPTDEQIQLALAEYDLSLQSDPRNTEQARANPRWIAAMRRDAMREAIRAAVTDASRILAQKDAELQRLREALKEITDDYADRFDLNRPSTNPGIKYVIEQARVALTRP